MNDILFALYVIVSAILALAGIVVNSSDPFLRDKPILSTIAWLAVTPFWPLVMLLMFVLGLWDEVTDLIKELRS